MPHIMLSLWCYWCSEAGRVRSVCCFNARSCWFGGCFICTSRDTIFDVMTLLKLENILQRLLHLLIRQECYIVGIEWRLERPIYQPGWYISRYLGFTDILILAKMADFISLSRCWQKMLLYSSHIQTTCSRKHNKASQDSCLAATLASAFS